MRFIQVAQSVLHWLHTLFKLCIGKKKSKLWKLLWFCTVMTAIVWKNTEYMKTDVLNGDVFFNLTFLTAKHSDMYCDKNNLRFSHSFLFAFLLSHMQQMSWLLFSLFSVASGELNATHFICKTDRFFSFFFLKTLA